MAAVPRTLFVAILFLGVTTSRCSEEEPSPLKINKNLFPKKYREEPTTTEVPTTEQWTANPEEPAPEDLTASEEEALARTRKSASATFCVEIRPSNPYQKPFQVCEPQQQQYGYVKPPRPEPVKYYQPHANPQPQAGYQQQSSYQQSQPSYQQSQPSYQQSQPSYQQSQPSYQYPQPAYQPQQPQQHQVQESGYERPMMVLPHVPVVQPYHVPAKPSYKPAAGSGYRSSGHGSSGGPYDVDEMAANPDELEGNMDARSAYYGDEGGYSGNSYGGDKATLFEYHKKKELSYLPYTKPKKLKFLKVLKDLKKDKYGYDDDYYQPHYYQPHYYQPHHYQPPPPHYGGYEHQPEHEVHKDSSHGLVITCQPSAVGYTGQQNQAELSKHMDLLKNIYTQSEKLYNQQQLSSSPSAYRSASGGEWKGVKPDGWKEMEARGGWKSEAEANMRSTGGGWEKNQAEGGMRSSGGGWEKNQAEEAMRSSGGGWEKNQAEGAMRSSGGGWDKSQVEGAARSSGGGWQPSQMDENVGKTQSMSVGPNPTARLMTQKEMETTAAFRNAQNNFASQQDMQRPQM